jgi:hypothetical protein
MSGRSGGHVDGFLLARCVFDRLRSHLLGNSITPSHPLGLRPSSAIVFGADDLDGWFGAHA